MAWCAMYTWLYMHRYIHVYTHIYTCSFSWQLWTLRVCVWVCVCVCVCVCSCACKRNNSKRLGPRSLGKWRIKDETITMSTERALAAINKPSLDFAHPPKSAPTYCREHTHTHTQTHTHTLSLSNTLPRSLSIPLSIYIHIPPPFPSTIYQFLPPTHPLPPTLSNSPHPHPRSFVTFDASNFLFLHWSHASCNHTGPARDVRRQGCGEHSAQHRREPRDAPTQSLCLFFCF